MGKVNILSPEVVNKIAAGEVIERPASVVKELIENSLDAGATSIEVYLKDAGKTLIQIKDNGHGIERDDLDKIFLRHATSKIASANDLYSILSLGFRGEALYSIAAIADIELLSKTKEQDSAWEVHLRGGEKINFRPTSFLEHGTEIKIQELFFNTPARKKFLKANMTEIHSVLNTFIPYTLLHNNVRFLLNHQSRDLVDLQPAQTKISRIAQALSVEEKFLLEVKEEFKEENVSVHMILGDINIVRARRDMQFIFVNGRPVQNKNISFHMNQIFKLIMPDDNFGLFVLFIEADPKEIDVNIHPTKREVKIRNEQSLCLLLKTMAERALMSHGETKQVYLNRPDSRLSTIIGEAFKSSSSQETFHEKPSFEETNETKALDTFAFPQTKKSEQPEFFIPTDNAFAKKEESLRDKLSRSRFIGNFINKYLFFETSKSLLVVDQHAAAERITYEHLIRQMQRGKVETQNLLSPIIIKLSPPEMLAYESCAEALKALGLDNNQWDKESIAIHTQPLLLKDIELAVREVLAGGTVSKNNHDTIARMACRSSVMAGEFLNDEKAEFFREELLQCLDPFICPHGRPTAIEISSDFLDKQFLRK